jgi:hypothetical protein
MVCLSECAATGAAIDEAADGQAAIAHTTQNGFLFEPRWPRGFAYPVCDNVFAASLKSRAVPGEPTKYGRTWDNGISDILMPLMPRKMGIRHQPGLSASSAG